MDHVGSTSWGFFLSFKFFQVLQVLSCTFHFLSVLLSSFKSTILLFIFLLFIFHSKDVLVAQLLNCQTIPVLVLKFKSDSTLLVSFFLLP